MKQTNIFLVVFAWVISINLQAQTQMQIEFEKFLTLFPTITWAQVQKATMDYSQIMSSCKELSYTDIRRNMWYEEPQNGPKNVYNHVRNELISADYDFKTPPPHIIDVDGDLIHYENVGGYESVYAVGKVDVSDDVVLLIICSLTDNTRKVKVAAAGNYTLLEEVHSKCCQLMKWTAKNHFASI